MRFSPYAAVPAPVEWSSNQAVSRRSERWRSSSVTRGPNPNARPYGPMRSTAGIGRPADGRKTSASSVDPSRKGTETSPRFLMPWALRRRWFRAQCSLRSSTPSASTSARTDGSKPKAPGGRSKSILSVNRPAAVRCASVTVTPATRSGSVPRLWISRATFVARSPACKRVLDGSRLIDVIAAAAGPLPRTSSPSDNVTRSPGWAEMNPPALDRERPSGQVQSRPITGPSTYAATSMGGLGSPASAIGGISVALRLDGQLPGQSPSSTWPATLAEAAWGAQQGGSLPSDAPHRPVPFEPALRVGPAR